MNGATLLQAARGPILLITLGVLFLLHQNTQHNFNRTFPVLLIVFGLMKLMEFFASRNEAPAPGPVYGVGGPIVTPPYTNPSYTPPLQPYAPASPSERGVFTPPAPASPTPPKIDDPPAASDGETDVPNTRAEEEGGNR